MSVELDLGRMLDRMARDISTVYDIDCRVVACTSASATTEGMAAELYWIVQEAATNAVRHGNARVIEITLEAKADELTLSITDDGTGIQPSAEPSDGLGLRILDYRARMLNGEIELTNSRDRGTRLMVRCPATNSATQRLSDAIRDPITVR